MDQQVIEDAGHVHINMTDHVRETLREEPSFTTRAQAYKEAEEQGWNLRKTGMMYWSLQRLGIAEEAVFDPTGKHEYEEGIYRNWINSTPLRTLTRTDEKGEEHTVGRYPAYTSDGKGVKASDSDEGLQVWHNYLFSRAIGHVRRSLTPMAKMGGDVVAEAQAYCDRIMAMAQGLAEAME